LIPLVIGSDKTHLTDFAGDRKAWPIYLSLGNISMKARRTRSLNAWIIIGYIPVVTWNAPTAIRTTLSSRLFHQCSKIIFRSIIDPGLRGIKLADSLGAVRNCFPRLAAWLSDNPEQLMLNCAAGNTCPTTTAGYNDLGETISFPPRTTEWILDRINLAVQETDPSDISKYQATALRYKLNGVHNPFWKDLPGYRAELCVSPDLFHGVLVFWRDHLFKWIKRLVGGEEIDRRLKVLQRVQGFRHFNKGITQVSHWTGREDKELQRVIVALIAGAPKVSAKAMRCIRAFNQFIYIAQYRSHSDETIGYLHQYLNEFHETKEVFIETGVRRGKGRVIIPHFKIPKMAIFRTFEWHIPQLGSSTQFTTEITETNHQPFAKEAFRATNKVNPGSQMCRYLDRKDRLRHAQELHSWLIEKMEEQRMAANLSLVSPGFRNDFRRVFFPVPDEEVPLSPRKNDRNVRLWLAPTPNKHKTSLEQVAREYQLPSLLVDIDRYLRSLDSQPGDRARNGRADVLYVDVWERLRIRVPDILNDAEFSHIHIIEARPPDEGTYPFGNGHCVLIHNTDQAEAVGIEGKVPPESAPVSSC
jgi:hypothetical protein